MIRMVQVVMRIRTDSQSIQAPRITRHIMSHRQRPSTSGSGRAAIVIVGSVAVMRCAAIAMGFGAVATDSGAMESGVVMQDAGVESMADTRTAGLEPAGDEIASLWPRAGRAYLPIEISSISKLSVLFGGMTPAAPRSP